MGSRAVRETWWCVSALGSSYYGVRARCGRAAGVLYGVWRVLGAPSNGRHWGSRQESINGESACVSSPPRPACPGMHAVYLLASR
jgi:hypothetical protein